MKWWSDIRHIGYGYDIWWYDIGSDDIIIHLFIVLYHVCSWVSGVITNTIHDCVNHHIYVLQIHMGLWWYDMVYNYHVDNICGILERYIGNVIILFDTWWIRSMVASLLAQSSLRRQAKAAQRLHIKTNPKTYRRSFRFLWSRSDRRWTIRVLCDRMIV